MASKTAIKVQTPKGKLEWVFFTGEGKENKHGKFKYQASIIVPDAAAQPFKDAIDEFWKENKPKGAKKPGTKGYRNQSRATDKVDEDGDKVYEDVPGFTEFYFSTAATWPNGKPRKISIFNAKNMPVAFTKKIGNGSVGRLAGIMDVYDVAGNQGVNLYFGAIKLLELIEYQEGPSFEDDDDDSEYEGGFTGAEESDFDGEEQQEAATAAKPRL